MYDLDAGVIEPLPAYRSLERAIGAAVRFRVARPEDDHLGLFEAILDGAVGLALADAHRTSPVVGRTPVPAFPTVWIVVNLGHADRVLEFSQRAQVVTDVAPGVVRRVTAGDRARTMDGLLPLDLVSDDVQSVVPADALVAGHATVFGVALAVGVEVDALHRIEQPVG